MSIKQVVIHSDLRRPDQIYQASDEVEQKLTIQRDGTVRLDAISHEGYPCWKEEKEIDEELAIEILNLLEQYAKQPAELSQAEASEWEMHIVYEDDSEQKLKGPMIGKVYAGDVDLTDFIRNHLPFMSLGVFDRTDSL